MQLLKLKSAYKVVSLYKQIELNKRIKINKQNNKLKKIRAKSSKQKSGKQNRVVMSLNLSYLFIHRLPKLK